MARNSNSNSTRNPSGRLSMAAENYLLSIFRMDERGERVNLTSLSEHLKTLPDDEGMGTALPSVGGMVRRLSREGLVETDASKEVRLTARGRRASESVVRRHRLAERLVVDILGLDLRLAHIEAHRLEHAISPVLEKQIDEALGPSYHLSVRAPHTGQQLQLQPQVIHARPGKRRRRARHRLDPGKMTPSCWGTLSRADWSPVGISPWGNPRAHAGSSR